MPKKSTSRCQGLDSTKLNIVNCKNENSLNTKVFIRSGKTHVALQVPLKASALRRRRKEAPAESGVCWGVVLATVSLLRDRSASPRRKRRRVDRADAGGPLPGSASQRLNTTGTANLAASSAKSRHLRSSLKLASTTTRCPSNGRFWEGFLPTRRK